MAMRQYQVRAVAVAVAVVAPLAVPRVVLDMLVKSLSPTHLRPHQQ